MTDQSGSRFRVVDGGLSKPERPKAKKPRKGEVTAYACGPCSDDLKRPYSVLLRATLHGVEQNGRLVGGEVWHVCARCHGAKFFITKAR